jgi:hypothetical protein
MLAAWLQDDTVFGVSLPAENFAKYKTATD